MEPKSLRDIFNEGEAIIEDIAKNGVTLSNHRQLIQKKTEFQIKLYDDMKSMKDKWLAQKIEENGYIDQLISQGTAKTPAKAMVDESSRPERYKLEKLDMDLELMIEIARNWTFHIRIGEIDLNKVGVGSEQI